MAHTLTHSLPFNSTPLRKENDRLVEAVRDERRALAVAQGHMQAAKNSAEHVKAKGGEATEADDAKTTDAAATDEAVPMEVEAKGNAKAEDAGEENKADTDNTKTTEVSFLCVCGDGLCVFLLYSTRCSPAD